MKVGEKDRHRRHGVICDAEDSDSHMTAPSEGSVIRAEKIVIPIKPKIRSNSESADFIPILTGHKRVSMAVKLMPKKDDAPRIQSGYGPSFVNLTRIKDAEIRLVLERLPLSL